MNVESSLIEGARTFGAIELRKLTAGSKNQWLKLSELLEADPVLDPTGWEFETAAYAWIHSEARDVVDKALADGSALKRIADFQFLLDDADMPAIRALADGDAKRSYERRVEILKRPGTDDTTPGEWRGQGG
jgi:hypothetical protein